MITIQLSAMTNEFINGDYEMDQRILKLNQSAFFSNRKKIINIITAGAAVFIVLILSLAVPKFSTIGNIVNVLEQITTMGFLCLGITCVLIVGGIDLSMPSVLMASATTGSMYMAKGGSVLIGILIMLCVSVLFGLINGLAIAKAKMVPFIVTLSTMVVAEGFSVMITNAKSVFGLPESFLVLGRKIGIIPLSVIVFFALAIIVHLFLKKTKHGRVYYMVGLSEPTAKVSGIATSKYILSAYIVSAVMSGIAGMMLVARTNMAGSTMVGDTMIMDTISAAVIGGASLSGGKGSIIGSVLGVLFITLISNFINLMGISQYMGMVIKGLLIVIIIGLDVLRSRK